MVIKTVCDNDIHNGYTLHTKQVRAGTLEDIYMQFDIRQRSTTHT